MAQDQLGFGSGLFGNKKTATSQPGTYPLGVGGGIAQMIASRREGVYAFMSPAQQADLRAKLEAQLADLSKQEYEWRKGLVKDKSVHADQLLKLYELKTGIGATGAKIQLGKQDILAGVYAEMGVTMFEHGITEADPTQIPGLTGPKGLTGEVSVAAAGLELKPAAFAAFNDAGTIAQKAAYLSEKVGKPIEAIINKTENYGARMGVGAGHGKLMTTRMAQSVTADQAYADIATFMKGAGTSGADQKEIMALFGDMHIARGDATFGVTNSTDALADASALKKEVGRKVTTSKYITDSLQKGVGFDRETEIADYLFGYYKNMEEGKDPTDAYHDLPPPQWLGDKESMLRAQLQRVNRSDPYADQVIRVAGLQGFDEYKAALGIKGNGYEANRKAAMIMAKDPKAASAAFKFFTEGKRSGVPDAKLDVMYRQYLSQGGAPEGGLFGKKFDSESVRRASLAGMSASEVESIGATVANYIDTNEFKYIKPPFATRYQEFKNSLIEKYAGETNADARTLLMETDTAAWLNKQDPAELDSDEGAGVISTIENETTKAVQWHRNIRSIEEGGKGVRFKDEQELLSEDLKHWEDMPSADTPPAKTANENLIGQREHYAALADPWDTGKVVGTGPRARGSVQTSEDAQRASETYGVEPPKPVTAESGAPVNKGGKKGGKGGKGGPKDTSQEDDFFGTNQSDRTQEDDFFGTHSVTVL